MWLSCVLGSYCGSCGSGGGVTVLAPEPLSSLALCGHPWGLVGTHPAGGFLLFPRLPAKPPHMAVVLSCSCCS